MFMTVKNIFTLRALNRWAFDAIKLLLKIGFLFTGDVDKAAIHLLCKNMDDLLRSRGKFSFRTVLILCIFS